MALYNDWIVALANQLQRRFDSILSEGGHNFEAGDEFEIAAMRALRAILPHRYGVCLGFIVDQHGGQAGDDLIIYDRSRFPTLQSLGEDPARRDRVPFEAVLAYIELKHTLHVKDLEKSQKHFGQSLRHACEQVSIARTLRREAVTQHPGSIMRVYVAPGYPRIENELYCAVWARNVAPATAAGDALASLCRTLHDEGVGRPDVVVAGNVLSLPAHYSPGPEGTIQVDGTRPFITADGNNPLFVESETAWGLALVHLMSTLESITLGELPWGRILHEALGGGFRVWGTGPTRDDPLR
jgi:hypothetical protein